MFVSDTGVAVEEATGETINEPQEDTLNANTMAIEIPHSVEHQPYIPLASAQDALAKVCMSCINRYCINSCMSTKVFFCVP